MIHCTNAFPILWKVCVKESANFRAERGGLFWVLKIHVVTLCHKGPVAFLEHNSLYFRGATAPLAA